MIDKLFNLFGYRLVKKSEEPREIVRAFADELEGHLDTNGTYYEKLSSPSLDTLARNAGGGMKALMGLAADHLVLPDLVDPEAIRWRAMNIAMYLLYIADYYGELGTRSMERVR